MSTLPVRSPLPNRVAPGQQAQLGGGHSGAPVVVGVEGDDGPLPPGQLPDEVFQHIRQLVGHTVLHRGGQVQDHLMALVGVEVVQHRRADLHRVIHLRPHKGLRGILEPQVHPPLNDGLGHLVDQIRRVGGDLGDAAAVHMEHHLPLEGGGGVVEVEDHVLRAPDGLEGLFDQVLPGLHQHLDGHVVGDVAPLDQLPADLILRLGGGGEADLDLLHPDVHQGVEIFQLLLQIHGVDEGLVPVPQIHRAPHRGLGNGPVRPGAVFNGLGLERDILLKTGLQLHGVFPPLDSRGNQKSPRRLCQGRNVVTPRLSAARIYFAVPP